MQLVPILVVTPIELWQSKKWPDSTVCRPIIGDIIISEDGARAKVVRVMHTTNQKRVPILLVELHEIRREVVSK